jgi:dCMP deaminase
MANYRQPADFYFLRMALLVSERGTCVRRKVGCILVNKKNHVLATGYNGNPSGFSHCLDNPCKGANSTSGKDLDKCEAIHAEQNALLQCKDVYDIDTVYCTVSPCIHCVKLLLNTSAKTIVFGEKYIQKDAERLWMMSDRGWSYININFILGKLN